MENLRKANVIRSERAQLKRRLAAGDERIVDVLSQPPPCAASATVHNALTWAPGMARTKAKRALKAANVSETRELGDLSHHERLRLGLTLIERNSVLWERWHGEEAA